MLTFFLTLLLSMWMVIVGCDRGGRGGSGDVYTSSEELVSVFKMELEMVQELDKHRVRLEEHVRTVRDYAREVQQVYVDENCWPPDACTDEQLLERIVANPIYCYQVLRRLNNEWKKLEGDLKTQLDSDATMRELKRLKRKHGGLPDDKDLHGAAKALNRLHGIYQFNISEFSQGKILGHQTSAALGAKDTLYLGRVAHLQNDPETAIKWLEQAALQATAATNANSTAVNQVEQIIKVVERKLNRRHSKRQAVEEDKESPNIVRTKYRLGHVPPKTPDVSKQICDVDQINLAALCQGNDIYPAEERAKLGCYYSHRGLGGNKDINEIYGSDRYFVIRPLKIEVAHPEPHPVIVVHDVVTDAECDALTKQAMPQIRRAPVGRDKEITENRVSKNTWLQDDSSHTVRSVSERINWITGLQTFGQLDRDGAGRKEEYEYLQIANYGIGGHYGCHQDPMYVYKEPNDNPIFNVEMKDGHYVTGDRMSTFMLYLSSVPKGGYTAFPRLGVSVAPVRGSAVFWHNIKRSGRSDMTMLHSGCPVLLGSKWVANKWVREFANMFNRKCSKNINV